MRRLSVTMEVRRLAAFRMPAIISCVAAAWSKSFADTHRPERLRITESLRAVTSKSWEIAVIFLKGVKMFRKTPVALLGPALPRAAS